MDFATVKDKLQEAGVRCDRGLTQAEVCLAEDLFSFRFPPDLKALLMFVLPTGRGWPNWRDVEDPEIARMLIWPYEGMCFDIENNVFWPDSWGAKPASLTEAFEIAKQKIETAPKLIPVFGHRYLPDRPSLEGNPVSLFIKRISFTTARTFGIILRMSSQIILELPVITLVIHFDR
jgi:hypothetical protein